MIEYRQILQTILNDGVSKTPNRGSVTVESTIVAPQAQFLSHDMSDGFPLLTCRDLSKVFPQALVELEGFLQGITSKRWYKERKCSFWNWWGNPNVYNRYRDTSGLSEKGLKLKTDDLGKIYPWQLRNWNGGRVVFTFNTELGEEEALITNSGFDQLKFVMDGLRNNPHDRGLVVNYWNPSDFERQALRTCHYSWQVNVVNNRLNLHYTMRSCDFLLGSNLHSYAMLLLLLSRWSGFEPGYLTATFMDCHIYESQFDVAAKLVDRQPKPLPKVNIPLNVTGPLDWDHTQYELINYVPHPPIKMPKPVI